MGASTFVLSPEGSGPDCFRHWEALLAGAVPAVQDSAVVRRLQRDHPALPLLVLPADAAGRSVVPSDARWWRAQHAKLRPLLDALNPRAVGGTPCLLDAAYWRLYLRSLRVRLEQSCIT